MSATPRRRQTIVPIITLLCSGIVAMLGLGAVGANAEGVPTPSETSVADVAVSTAPSQLIDVPIVVTPTTPTGTTMPVEP
jgi:hypothetical protein